MGNAVRLERLIYGVEQAGRQWFLLLNKTMMKDAGMTQSKADPCLYKQEKGACMCYICGTSRQEWIKHVISSTGDFQLVASVKSSGTWGVL